MNRRLAPKRRAGELATTVGDHLVHIHIELRAAAGHPPVQRKHVVMLASEDFVADLNDQIVTLLVEPLTGIVGIGCGFFQGGVGGDHFPGNQILANAEVLKRALSLSAPEFVSSNIYFAETIGFLANVRHLLSPFFWNSTFLLKPKNDGALRSSAECYSRTPARTTSHSVGSPRECRQARDQKCRTLFGGSMFSFTKMVCALMPA